MEIPNGYHVVGAGKIASIVTYLQMTSRPEEVDPQPPAGCHLQRVKQMDLTRYRALFRRIGENWLWFSRLVLSDEELRSILHHPKQELYVLSQDGEDVGLMELDRRVAREVELAFFGITPERTGQGLGKYLIQEAIRLAWQGDTVRFWLHTCTLDSPQALGFYQRAGFRPYRRAIEVADDPRLTGKLPRHVASWYPIL
ncbi:MAG: GNAT family N-acetyltransferase [Bryobacteraceae bacterium]|nr:GNAT family N-acetyltransferase [Bryobacteraceae bacterium]MDW8380176.1 GNAT family N-acetyltransferase [Bryobacterales bacterium]